MRADIKAEWVRRLRSGDYTQGKNQLAYQDEKGKLHHCCLGVLCEMAAEDGIVDRLSAETMSTIMFRDKPIDGNYRSAESQILPRSVRSWAGLDTDVAAFGPTDPANAKRPYDHRSCLAEENDSGKTFAQIADLIEEHF